MLRTDLDIVMVALRDADWPFLIGEHKRGKIYMDSVHLAAYKADGQLVGTAYSIPVYREADLENGKWQYVDSAGVEIATNV